MAITRVVIGQTEAASLDGLPPDWPMTFCFGQIGKITYMPPVKLESERSDRAGTAWKGRTIFSFEPLFGVGIPESIYRL